MKQVKYLLMALMCLISSSVMADDTPIPVEQLPEAAKTFVQTNFKGQKIVYAEKDWNSFECRLADGTKIEFTKKGAWKKIDRKAAAVPEAIVPAAIQDDTIAPTTARIRIACMDLLIAARMPCSM